jgi:predicted nucleic acid-binding protein
MNLVIDTNIVIAAILKKSVTQDLLFNQNLQLHAPEFIREEIVKHKKELMKKAGYGERMFDEIVAILFSRIMVVPYVEYAEFKEKAIAISPDRNDWPFIALAIYIDSDIWSNDSDLKNKQDKVKIYKTAEIIKLLG